MAGLGGAAEDEGAAQLRRGSISAGAGQVWLQPFHPASIISPPGALHRQQQQAPTKVLRLGCSAAIVVVLASSGIRLTSGEPGVVLVSRRAAMRSGLRAQLLAGGRGGRMQQLADADADADEEEEDPVIRFENDNKVMGGDLQVPVSMVDYENLGEGSIVDQRYPRKLPGLLASRPRAGAP